MPHFISRLCESCIEIDILYYATNRSKIIGTAALVIIKRALSKHIHENF